MVLSQIYQCGQTYFLKQNAFCNVKNFCDRCGIVHTWVNERFLEEMVINDKLDVVNVLMCKK